MILQIAQMTTGFSIGLNGAILVAVIGAVLGFMFKAALQDRGHQLKRHDVLVENCAVLQVHIAKLDSGLDSQLEDISTPSDFGGGVNVKILYPLMNQVHLASAACKMRTDDEKLTELFDEIISLMRAPEIFYQSESIMGHDYDSEHAYYDLFREMPEQLTRLSSSLADRVRFVGKHRSSFLLNTLQMFERINNETTL